MTRIAILGARGRLGRAVAKAFLEAGYEVRAITRDGKLPSDLAPKASLPTRSTVPSSSTPPPASTSSSTA